MTINQVISVRSLPDWLIAAQVSGGFYLLVLASVLYAMFGYAILLTLTNNSHQAF
jgi:hypothetical protein